MSRTSIEWTHRPGKVGRNWNIVGGCRRISPGCQHCYAETMAKRFSKEGMWGHGLVDDKGRWNGEVKLRRNLLRQSLGWKKPACAFVCSTSDLFQGDVSNEFLAAAFGVMAATPQHTYLLLTKRPARALEFFEWAEGEPELATSALDICLHHAEEATGQSLKAPGVWPPANIEIGVSVEDQDRADERIPILLKLSARKRFLSCEPLLGPVDLTKWLMPRGPMLPEEAPKSWADWEWDDWVPEEIRSHIESFWGEFSGRQPKNWLTDMLRQGSPPYGAVVACNTVFNDDRTYTGRWVHAWGNIGRIILDDGSVKCASIPTGGFLNFGPPSYRYSPPIDQVIVGGESGVGARPMKLEWARDLRHQCKAATVAFFMKQTGSHGRRDKGSKLTDLPEDLRVREWPGGAQ